MPNGLVVVAEYLDYDEARTVAGALRSRGIRAVLPHDPRDTQVRMGRLVMPRTRTGTNSYVLELLVEEEDAEEALALIAAMSSTAGLPEYQDDDDVISAWHGAKLAAYLRYKRRAARRHVVVLVGLLGCLMAIGVIGYVVSADDRRVPPARVGVALNADNRPELVVAQCPGRGVLDAAIVDAGHPQQATVWRGSSRYGDAGTKRMTLNDSDGQLVLLDGDGLDGRTLAVGPIHNDRHKDLPVPTIVFTVSALRREEVLFATVPGQPPAYLSRAAFEQPPPGC